MKLLIEKNIDCENILIEENLTEGTSIKQYYIKGPFLQSEIKNHNHRKYPFEIMEQEVSRYIKAKLSDNQAVGELGHPDTPTINLDRVSHKITKLTQDDKNWIGEAKIIDTPFGLIVKRLMDEKVKFGVSSRGLGSLKEVDGTNVVQKDFYLVTPADIVSDPSGPDCWATAIMEKREWALGSDGSIQEFAVKEIDKAVDTRIHRIDELKLLCAFERVLDAIVPRK